MKIDPGHLPVLREGDRDLAVKAMQGATARYLEHHGIKTENLKNGVFGQRTINDVNRVKRHSGIEPVVGIYVGTKYWDAIKPFLTDTNQRWLSKRRTQVIAHNKKEAARREAIKKAESSEERRFEKAIRRMWENRGHLTYTWTRPFSYNPDKAWTYDCSGTVSVIYYLAGMPDPNSLGHIGLGYTGTLWPNGETVLGDPQIGDLAFYGWDSRGNFPSHVAIVIPPKLAIELARNTQFVFDIDPNGPNVLSFGSNPMRVARLRYRLDYRGCKRYVDD